MCVVSMRVIGIAVEPAVKTHRTVRRQTSAFVVLRTLCRTTSTQRPTMNSEWKKEILKPINVCVAALLDPQYSCAHCLQLLQSEQKRQKREDKNDYRA